MKKVVRREAYMHDYDGAITENVIGVRTVESHAAFLLPRLEAGMRLLDCGCGPGSITLGLAEAVAPGEAIGVDVEEGQLIRAQEKADERGLTNIRFQQGDVYRLPFPDDAFDVVFSQAMLDHLRDPDAAIAEMFRVLRPGGLIALKDIDLEFVEMTPMDQVLRTALEVWLQYRRHCGGNPYLGRELAGLLRAAGFSDVVKSETWDVWSTRNEIDNLAPALKDDFAGPKISATAVAENWTTPDRMSQISGSIDTWRASPNSAMFIKWCEALGRKPELCAPRKPETIIGT